MPMTVTSPFAFGSANLIVAFAMSLVGALFGLSCLVRARKTTSHRYGIRWLIFGAAALAVVGVWLTHFIAVLGFDVPSSPVRYSVLQTFGSLLIAIIVIGAAMRVVGTERPSIVRVLFAGLLIGGGISAMHYSGVAASHVEGFYTYDVHLVEASVLIAVVGSIIALALTVWTDSYVAIGVAAVVFATMVAATHYTGMAALRVHLTAGGHAPSGVEVISIVIPVTIGGVLTLLAMLFAALGMMSDDGDPLDADRPGSGREPAPVRPMWHIPQQYATPEQNGHRDLAPEIVTVTHLRRHG